MNDKFKNRKHTISFKTAIDGIKTAFITQPNLKVMLFFASITFLFSYLLKLNYLEWVMIILTVFIVFIAEMMNTSIEEMVDLITMEWRQEAKVAKDVASGMVLLAVIGSLIIGLLIFLPHILVIF